MSKSRKKLLMSSLVMLIVAAIALSTATFAWFSSSKEAALTGVEFKAEAAAGVQISVDAATWKSAVTSAEIATEIAKESGSAQNGRIVSATQMSPASSVGAVSGGAMSIFEGSVDTANGGTSFISKVASKGTQGAASTGYYVFDLYFYNTGNSDLTLSLDPTSKVAGKEGATSGIENAARIAFIDQGVKAVTADAIALAGGDGTAVIWEPNDTIHTTFATTSRGAGTGKLAYKGINATGSGAWDGNAVTDTIVGDATTVNLSNATITVLKPGITKITLYVWIEGQDVDCNNAESGGSVTCDLKFVVTEVTT